MKPTVQSPDFYKIGNDYAQAPLSSFYDTANYTTADALKVLGLTAAPTSGEEKAAYDRLLETPKYYQDGIYRHLSSALSGMSDEDGFNKRRVFVGNDGKYLSAGALFNTSATSAKEPAVDNEYYGEADVIEPPQYSPAAPVTGG